ncbi:hypothetical protein EMIHUDRAFT_204848 [Emiliania huxleyi CCMP1516]|uniref:J domain-containing protein n=2 Tax=Emiliania huxleyi TaxID=2903 RepID=A0A0D3JWG4_EMIH1|nr:hypothetical protein EMIHUDRAFT_204848 [Emiliania huxleyi CCMP1516]EOD27849.1 hypothetical protein EMIHUDRAFT_204848 [Emiliania huxleyi CCMP1516]|eukprot:XP_005780278.1 hypothetical protein EMIHUDRAFT_204848 [Emiliania huxleyi CCMP1516]
MTLSDAKKAKGGFHARVQAINAWLAAAQPDVLIPEYCAGWAVPGVYLRTDKDGKRKDECMADFPEKRWSGEWWRFWREHIEPVIAGKVPGPPRKSVYRKLSDLREGPAPAPESADAASGRRAKRQKLGPAASAGAAGSHSASAAEPLVGAVVPEPLVAEAEGLRLHLSSSSATGYKGVSIERGVYGSRFQARHTVDGRQVRFGSFGTAMEAAVAYARAVGEYTPALAAEPAAVAAEAEVVAEAEGLRLHLSSSSATGYKNVCNNGSRFQARRWVDGRQVCCGYFGTAVEAAVAYARAVGEYQPPAHPSPAVAAEAEGLRLHLSSSSPTGYKGVQQRPSGRFKAGHRVDGSSGGIVDVDCPLDALVAAVLAGAPRAVQDPWGCLGLQQLTGREASRKRYLQLVRRLHPDRCGHPRAGECFALVEEAWRAIEARGEGGRSAG